MSEKAQDPTGGATRSSENAKSSVKPEAMHLLAASTTTSSSEDGTMTPMSSYFEQPLTTPWWSIPSPGKTYRIYLKGTDKVIMVAEGKVVVQPMADGRLGGGWNWACVEQGSWLGFRNHVSGNFLGRTTNELVPDIQARCPYQSVNDSFCVRHHPDGGYLLLVVVAHKGYMQQVGVAADGKTVVGKSTDGDLWLFEEVQGSDALTPPPKQSLPPKDSVPQRKSVPTTTSATVTIDEECLAGLVVLAMLVYLICA